MCDKYFEQLREELLEAAKTRDSFDPYRMYDWTDKVLLRDGTKVDGPLKDFYDFLKKKISTQYEGIRISISVVRNRLEFLINDQGYCTGDCLFAIIIKRKIEGRNAYGCNTYKVDKISFEAKGNARCLSDVITSFVQRAEEMTHRNEEIVEAFSEKLIRHGLKVKDVSEMMNEYYSLSNQARAMLEKKGLGNN